MPSLLLYKQVNLREYMDSFQKEPHFILMCVCACVCVYMYVCMCTASRHWHTHV